MINGIEDVHAALDFLLCSSVTSGEGVVVSRSGSLVRLSAAVFSDGPAIIPVLSVSEAPVLGWTAVPVMPLVPVSGVVVPVLGVVAAGELVVGVVCCVAEGAATGAVVEGVMAAGVETEGVAVGAVVDGVVAAGVVAEGVEAAGAVVEGVAAAGVEAEGVVAVGAVVDGVVAAGAVVEGVVAAGAVVDGVVAAGEAAAVVVLDAAGRPDDGVFAIGCPGVTCTKSIVAFLELSLCLTAPTRLFVSPPPVLTMTIFFGRAGREAAYCSAKLIAEPMLLPLSIGYWISILPIIVSISPTLMILRAISSLGELEKVIK